MKNQFVSLLQFKYGPVHIIKTPQFETNTAVGKEEVLWVENRRCYLCGGGVQVNRELPPSVIRLQRKDERRIYSWLTYTFKAVSRDFGCFYKDDRRPTTGRRSKREGRRRRKGTFFATIIIICHLAAHVFCCVSYTIPLLVFILMTGPRNHLCDAIKIITTNTVEMHRKMITGDIST